MSEDILVYIYYRYSLAALDVIRCSVSYELKAVIIGVLY